MRRIVVWTSFTSLSLLPTLPHPHSLSLSLALTHFTPLSLSVLPTLSLILPYPLYPYSISLSRAHTHTQTNESWRFSLLTFHGHKEQGNALMRMYKQGTAQEYCTTNITCTLPIPDVGIPGQWLKIRTQYCCRKVITIWLWI